MSQFARRTQFASSQSATQAPPTVAIKFRASSHAAGNTASLTVNIPTGTRAGDVMVLITGWSISSGQTLTKPSDWTEVGAEVDDDGTLGSRVFWKVATGSDADLSLTLSAIGNIAATMTSYENVNNATPIDAFATSTEPTSSQSHATPSVSLGYSNDWLISAVVDKASAGATTTWIAPSGMTLRAADYNTGTYGVTVATSDSGAVVSSGSHGGNTWTSDSATSHAVMWRFGLRVSDIPTDTGGDGGDPVTGATMFGFNVYTVAYDAYDPASETPTQQVNRLINDFGTFGDSKCFYGGFLPSTYNTSAGEGLSPAKWCTVCFNWTIGSIANGSHDSQIIAYAQSVPAGRAVRLSYNEIDNHISGSQWTQYVADMDYLYDLLKSLTLTGTVEVWDCFMSYSIDSASGPAWSDSWINPAKRHGIVWDHYWNQSTVDKSGGIAIGNITSKMNHLGMSRWCIGELGDRRPGTSGSTETDDAARAQHMATHIDALLAASPKPEGITWFDLLGTTGDHRILTPPLGNDTAMQAMYKSYIDASMGR